jgi:hypothetical protein
VAHDAGIACAIILANEEGVFVFIANKTLFEVDRPSRPIKNRCDAAKIGSGFGKQLKFRLDPASVKGRSIVGCDVCTFVDEQDCAT